LPGETPGGASQTTNTSKIVEVTKAETPPKRKQRRYCTGRNRHLGIKATPETVERFYEIADTRNLPLGGCSRLSSECDFATPKKAHLAKMHNS
jgi:hypothetical protein